MRQFILPIILGSAAIVTVVAYAHSARPAVGATAPQATQAASLTAGPSARVAGAAQPAAADQSPVLVELFTSQGCSSCPPADTVLASLSSNPRVVALSRPVTYWDNLGWKDSLAREENTAQQRAYARRGISDGSVYTPETVVQGQNGTIGSRRAELNRLIASATTAPAHRLSAHDHAVATAGAVTTPAELRFVAVGSQRDVRIGGGENGGRVVRYTNVVLDEQTVPCTTGAPCSAALPASLRSHHGADKFAAILQAPNNGRVLAVTWL